jgi:hypothetical protein
MAIHRTYIGQTSGTGGFTGFLDIIVGGISPLILDPAATPGEVVSSVGTPARPVAGSPGAPRVVPPGGWVGLADGWYYEWRGRPIFFEKRSTDPPGAGIAAGFVPRLRLGWKAVVYGISQEPAGPDSPTAATFSVFPSRTLAGDISVYPTGTIPFPDPLYGPVLRISSRDAPTNNLIGRLFICHLDIFEQRDEDRDAVAGP